MQLLAQRLDRRDEPHDLRGAVAELLLVGDDPGDLQRELEPLGSAPASSPGPCWASGAGRTCCPPRRSGSGRRNTPGSRPPASPRGRKRPPSRDSSSRCNRLVWDVAVHSCPYCRRRRIARKLGSPPRRASNSPRTEALPMTTIDREPPVASPPLADGQRLDRATFHERYAAMPPEFRAELIGGVVHVMTSPLRRRHGAASAIGRASGSACIAPEPRASRSSTTPRPSWTMRRSRNPTSR